MKPKSTAILALICLVVSSLVAPARANEGADSHEASLTQQSIQQFYDELDH